MTGYSLPPRRLDQYLPPGWSGAMPAPLQNIIARTVTVLGAGDGVFVYDAAGHLRSADVGQVTTDPHQGVTCQQGISTFNGHGAVVTLLSSSVGAFFQYQDLGTSTQGAMILAVASVAGADPVTGTAFAAGLTGIDPVFGDFLKAVGSKIQLGVGGALTRDAQITANQAPSSSQNPFVLIDAPEETTAAHMQQLWQGDSPDGTRFSQLLIGRVSGGAVLAPATKGMVEIQYPGLAGEGAALELVMPAQSLNAVDVQATGDTQGRFRINTQGDHRWGSGSAPTDCLLGRTAAAVLEAQSCHLGVQTAGFGLRVGEGTNAKQGVATLAGGTVTVSNTAVTANSRIFLTAQDNNTTGALRISARAAGTSFTITSSNAGDSGVVAYEMFEPG